MTEEMITTLPQMLKAGRDRRFNQLLQLRQAEASVPVRKALDAGDACGDEHIEDEQL